MSAIFDKFRNYWQRIFADRFNAIVASISKVPRENIVAAFSEAPALIQEAQKQDGTGWDRLKLVVDALRKYIPQDYGEIASTVLTIVVAGARLFEMLKKK